jgi:hypothetical protein
MIYLIIPYKDKNIAKEYGAKWDKKLKRWYCDDENNELCSIYEKYPDEVNIIGEDRIIESLNRLITENPLIKNSIVKEVGNNPEMILLFLKNNCKNAVEQLAKTPAQLTPKLNFSKPF